jgi:hypothetical protein
VRNPASVVEGFADPHPSLLITNPRILAVLEEDRFSFGDVLGVRNTLAPRREDYSEESGKVLLRSPIYAGLVRALTDEIETYRKATHSAGVGPGFLHRLFDTSWLSSKRVHFELVGVVNRIDFRMLVPPGCGQTRLVYRLALQPGGVFSRFRWTPRPETRLPMTVNVIYENRQDSCQELAKQWLSLEAGGDVLQQLRNGPLATLDPTRIDRIEVNLQSMRENSTGPSMDDHAEYLLRGFNVVNGRLVPDSLRDMPDPRLPPAGKEELRKWIVANLRAIDDGSAEVPTRFLARRAVSVSPRGLSRLENRPFKQLFPDEDAAFADADFAGTRVATSPAMLVRRLDEMSCVGCHQTRTIAGFQLLGEDRTPATFNTLTLGISEHLREILEWRLGFLEEAAAGQGWTEPVPIAERADGRGVEGAHCIVATDASTEYPEWPCDPGLHCAPSLVDGDPVGYCVQSGPRRAGDACQNVQLATSAGPDGDKVTPDPTLGCGEEPAKNAPLRVARAESLLASNLRNPGPKPGLPLRGSRCEINRNGFPGGMCSAVCSESGKREAAGVCETIPHMGFEKDCLAPRAIIERCLTEAPNFSVELLRPCSRTEACRDDYACARFPGLPLNEGACVPPYFIFQARVDGPPVDR